MKDKSDFEYELMAKFLAGEISSEEQQNLEYWLNESEENLLVFENIKTFDEFVKIYKDIKKTDVLKAKELTLYRITRQNRLKERIENETNEFVKKLYLKRFLLYAASVTILIGISLLIFITSESSGNNLTYTQITAPKGSRTNLILADGSTVWLNSGSILKYDNNFNDKDRSVFLEGEAFFEVSKNSSKPLRIELSRHPLRIR